MTLEMNFDQSTFATMFDIFLKDGGRRRLLVCGHSE